MSFTTAIRAALRQGAARVYGAKRYLALAYAWNLILAASLGSVLYGALQASLGSSLAGERMRDGWDSLWYYSFSAQASGVAATFRPSITGIGAVLDALDAFLDGFTALLFGGLGSGVLPLTVVYVVSWTFLGAGFIATFVGQERGVGFLARAARWFPKLFVVTLVGLVFYGVLLGPVRGRLDGFVGEALHDTFDERLRFAWTVAEYLVLWMAIWLGSLVLDYTKVVVVRRGVSTEWGAIPAALVLASRILAGHPLKTGGLFLSTGLLWIAILLLYWAVVPGTADSSPLAIAITFLLGQLYVFARIGLRCLFQASEVVMCEALDWRG